MAPPHLKILLSASYGGDAPVLATAARLAVELAAGEGTARVYVVEPTGAFENDPNVTDKKFPGNPTRSYRSAAPLRITGEVTDWARLTCGPRRGIR
jgi:rifampin ADP-ribosylating transferase